MQNILLPETTTVDENADACIIPGFENSVLNVVIAAVIPSNNLTNRFRLTPAKDGGVYLCGCEVCDKSYRNNENIVS